MHILAPKSILSFEPFKASSAKKEGNKLLTLKLMNSIPLQINLSTFEEMNHFHYKSSGVMFNILNDFDQNLLIRV